MFDWLKESCRIVTCFAKLAKNSHGDDVADQCHAM
ncbi:hypothetical protein CQ014_20480 [Pseudomonas lurida]|nr:hypothetical protein CLM75_08025 [Pseudomonas lurida]PRA14454.1 hypothetical protein CQ002_20875 [Pseudomonas sp. MYb13]PRA20035.1 hypothetical protein CQ004_20490 [Pseudomonas lurida]PRA31886.1 hypothetical protein CQ005_20555 [Pseudomonas lurida]PRB98170.1 hypothetical protein CQ014_20480 [Pseudomonas lurida]